jgi:Fe2+ or Zn2+ uptake regulation protein
MPMSKTNDNHITRQWHIIQYLISLDNYVSSDTVFQYLQQQGIEVKDVRTIQRDLNTLSEIFPIECRKDDKPYSWRWQRVDNNKKNLMSYEQAMIFTLVDNELRDLLPDDLLKRLYPLFVKAKMILAGIDYQRHDHTATSHDTFNSPYGFTGRSTSPITAVLRSIEQLAKLNPFKNTSDDFEPWQCMVNAQDIHHLEAVLSQQGYADLADKLKGLDKQLKVIK